MKSNNKAGTSFARKRLAILGLGKMGTILLQPLLDQGLFSRRAVRATVQHRDRSRLLSRQLKVPVTTDNAGATLDADIILVCVKPPAVREVLEQLRDLSPRQLVVSIAASVSTAYIEKILPPGMAVVRAMPNTPCMVGSGMTAICRGSHATEEHLKTTSALFEAVGRTVVVDEKHMDAVTGLSASGPAYLYIILESLAEAGVKVGLPRELATTLAAQTMLGSARVILETGDHPALLKDAVTTPAGCTIDGIMELEEGKLRVTLIKAVVKAAHRAKELLFAE